MHIDPLFPQEKVDKEVSNIESEFVLKYSDENRRMDNVLTNAMDVDHPFKIFGTGNTKTLADIFTNDYYKDDSKFNNRNAVR